MKSFNIALITLFVLVTPILAADDPYETVCHGRNMTNGKFGEFVQGEIADFYIRCNAEFIKSLDNIVAAGHQNEIKTITDEIPAFSFLNGETEVPVTAGSESAARSWCSQIYPVNTTFIAPSNISEVWNKLQCGKLVKLTAKYLNITDKDDCWKSIKKIHNNRCYWRWNEYVFSEQRDFFETVRDEVHSIDWLYLFMVIIGSVVGSFLLTLILGLIMNIVKKHMSKKSE